MRAIAFALALALAGPPAVAHDFWIQPEAFHIGSGTTTPMSLQVGHGAARQRSQIPMRRILRFAAVGPDRMTRDLRASLDLGGDTADGLLVFDAPGPHLVVLQTDNGGRSHLPADRFRAYAEEEGLTPALERATSAASSERYSRNAKAIVQVGPAGDAPSLARPVGLPLEIVPEAMPRAGMPLPVRVFYRGRPLAGALVKLTDLDQDAQPLETDRTDGEGRARFAIPAQGRWLLTVVWTRPLPKSEDAEFDTVFSSLSFGVP